MLIGTAAAYDIPGIIVVRVLVAADISSAGVGIPAMRTATTPVSYTHLTLPTILLV